MSTFFCDEQMEVELDAQTEWITVGGSELDGLMPVVMKQ